MPTIYVSRLGPQSTQLRLRDSEGHNPNNDNLTTDVSAGDTITWEKDPYADPPNPQPGYYPISSIISVTGMLEDPGPPVKYPGSQQLFASGPTVTNGVATATIVNKSPGQGKFENYQIGFTVPNDSTTYYDDPQLKMK